MKKSHSKLLIFLTVFIDLLGFGIIIPILPVISRQYPAPADLGAGVGAGVLMSSFSLLQMLFSPFWGRLSDQYGRRPILLLSLFGSTASYLLFAFSHNFSMLLASRILAGICGANITAAQAYIADITPPEKRTAGMGLIGMAFGLGFTFGPAIGGLASRYWSAWHPGAPIQMGPGLIAGLICGVNLLWALAMLPESLPPQRRDRAPARRLASLHETMGNLRHPSIGPLIALFFLITFAFSNLEVSFTLYATGVLHIGQDKIGLFFMTYGILMSLVQGGLVRQLVKVIPERTLLIPGVALLALGLFTIPLAANLVHAAGTMMLMALGQGLSMPCVMSLISRSAGVRVQGNVSGTSQGASSLARIIGPMIGGMLFDHGPHWPFWIAAIVMTLAAAWAVLIRGRLGALDVRHAAAPHAVTARMEHHA